MRAAGLALAFVVVGCAMAFGYMAADRESFASLRVLGFVDRKESSGGEAYPQANREGKRDRMAPLRAEFKDFELEQSVLQRGDSLRQGYAAVDPVTPPLPSAEPAPLPKPRPKALLLRRQQASYTLLSDLQIEAIKARLKLTSEQERNWPAVEVALRGLTTRLHEMKKSGGAPTGLQPDSEELARLKAAAAPFVAQLSADQKRELRTLAHLIGLGKVMAQL